MSLAISHSSGVYTPRRSQETVLYGVLQEHLETFIERAESDGRELPAFVKKELRAFLECGVIELGFARLECSGCRYNRLLPFSCKGRGFCPSCCGRRMSETAAHLVDGVFPAVPVRQWVLSLPFDLRARVAFDSELRRLVLRAFLRVVFAWLRRQGRAQGVREPRCGSVTFEQRFGSDLRLNLHFHVLVLDGVYSASSGEAVFHRVAAPSDEEQAELVAKVYRKVRRILERRGWVDEAEEWAARDQEVPLELEFASASAAGRIAQGARRGLRVPRGERWSRAGVRPGQGRRPGRSGGFDLHAGVAVEAADRSGLERLCRYISRPPIATDRLELTAQGNVRYHFRRAWRNGVTSVEYQPLEFVGRLVPLIPRPRAHLIHFHGVLAARSKLRPLIVPPKEAEGPECGHGSLTCRLGQETGLRLPEPEIPDFPARQASKRTWAQLLARVFDVDGLKCPSCEDGRLRIVAFITSPDTVRTILEGMHLPTAIPRAVSARPPPQEEIDFFQ